MSRRHHRGRRRHRGRCCGVVDDNSSRCGPVKLSGEIKTRYASLTWPVDVD